MRDLFPEYSEPPADYTAIWAQATFVFDTNVLINLYRYGEATRKDFLGVLQTLSDRVWIPYHVALEFYRNRTAVIADQLKLFTSVRESIATAQKSLTSSLDKLHLEKRHSSIRPTQLVEDIAKLVNTFCEELDALERTQQPLTGDDPLKSTIESLFEGRTGTAPTEDLLKSMLKDADDRYRCRVPPGYKDTDKDKVTDSDFTHGGIIYKRKYGDLIVWRQTLAHAKATKLPTIVFVTADAKEDWFQQLDCNGNKTIGPRPELIEEARRVADITTMRIYTADQFLKFARKFTEAEVTDKSIAEVRDISVGTIGTVPIGRRFRGAAAAAFCEWAIKVLGYNSFHFSGDRPTFIQLYRDNGITNVMLRDCPDSNSLAKEIVAVADNFRQIWEGRSFGPKMMLALVATNNEDLALSRSAERTVVREFPLGIDVVAGKLVNGSFVPTYHRHLPKA